MGKQARRTSHLARNARAAEQERARRRNRLIAGGGGLVIVGLLIAIVVSLVQAAKPADTRNTDTTRVVAPGNVTATGAIPIGSATAPVKVEIYLDYMCPFCGRFERANSSELERLVAEGTVRVELYALSFLDKTSLGTKYSTRAANAVATVADRAPDRVLAFNAALFSRQPNEGSAGLSDSDIAALAQSVGVAGDVVDSFAAGTFQPWIAEVTDAAFGNGISGTPTVKINGKVYQGDLYTAGPLTQAINAVRGQ